MSQDNQTNVINFEKKGRRKAFARLTKNYNGMLVHIMQQAMFDGGEHFDDNGLPLCRAMDSAKMRHGAVANAAIFFVALLYARARMEQDDGSSSGLGPFAHNADLRVKNYHLDYLGKGRIVIAGKYKRDLASIEQNYARAIFDALRIEAKNDPDFSEAEFWADVFRGFSDHDNSGVVLRAAGLVLLDHLTHFHLALTHHMKQTA